MEGVKVEEFENQRYKIMDKSILLFSRVSLLKFYLELSTFLRYKDIYSRVREEYEKTFFCKTGCSGNSLATGKSCEFEL